MTIQEMYDWAKENNYLDVPIAKNMNLELKDVENIIYLKAKFLDNEEEYNRVIIDWNSIKIKSFNTTYMYPV